MTAKMPETSMSQLETDKDILDSHLRQFGLQVAADGVHLRWARGNPRHPRNWSILRKAYDTSLIIFLELFTTAISASGGLGSIVFPPYSEAFGRKNLYILSTALYSISCAIVAAVPSLSGVIVGRLFSGIVSAIPTTVVIGSIEDMFNSRDRVWVLCLWAIVANLGLVTGPILSTYIIEDLNWRWLFYVAAIVTGSLTFILLTIRESRPSLLLAQEVAKVRKVTGIEGLKGLNPDHTPDLRTFVRTALFRPVRLFFTELIVFFVSIISAIAVALVYLFTEALPPIYEAFGFTTKQACLPFIAIGIGLSLGFCTRSIDMRIIDNHRQKGQPLLPEHKLTGFWIGSFVLTVALWAFAWTIPPQVANLHWIVSVLCLVLIGYSLNEIEYVLGGYLTDSYLSYAASGLAALSLVRAVLSAVLPLIAPPMFGNLGANMAISVLAAIATMFCIVPPLFSRFGEKIRARSQFAKHSLRIYNEHSVDEDGY
ncbi:major facilitator superfamily domain-containing protein [Aspergillus leporis]|uniref:Major facilitator superfamily domain-containing protein n=1 Tax=Aspergillus leporis TaxID=41062 RepID=A0A5N5WI33_9EURO|nr:major facilitator superfamily domain-containing protein [Aspergillus leporis]